MDWNDLEQSTPSSIRSLLYDRGGLLFEEAPSMQYGPLVDEWNDDLQDDE